MFSAINRQRCHNDSDENYTNSFVRVYISSVLIHWSCSCSFSSIFPYPFSLSLPPLDRNFPSFPQSWPHPPTHNIYRTFSLFVFSVLCLSSSHSAWPSTPVPTCCFLIPLFPLTYVSPSTAYLSFSLNINHKHRDK